jgi:hypothetical protein
MTEYERISLAVQLLNALSNGVMDATLRQAVVDKCLDLLGTPSQKTTVEKSA